MRQSLGPSCWVKKSLTPDTETSMALKHNCGKQGVRVGWLTIFGPCLRVTSSVDSATRRTRRRALRLCLATSRERTAASLKNWQKSGLQRKQEIRRCSIVDID